MARERSLLALVLVCVLVHASHHLVLAQTAMAEIVISPEAQTDVLIGDTVLFTCVAYGDSVSTISWSRGGNNLMNDSQRVTIYEEEFTEGGITFVQSILEICSVGLGDTTEGYSCSAGTGADMDDATFELNTQQILIYPEDTEVIAGDTVLLTCVSYQSPITWSQEGVELVNDSMRITVYQEQFVESGFTFYQSILQICSTESSDSGTYSCIADGGDGENSSISFQLTVQTPPQIVLHPVDLTEIPDGDTVLLTCVAYGDQPLSISWSREGSVLMNDSQRITIYEAEIEEGGTTFIQSILQICSIGADDAGVYSCNAENEVGNDTANFELILAEAPVQIVLHPVNLTDVPDGDTVLLTCVAYGDLPLSISWSREGSVLMNDSQRITIYEAEIEEGGSTFLQSILQICSTEANDAGVYSCNAENEAGNDTASFELTVTPPEVAVQIVLHPVDPTDIPDGDTVLLTCVAYGDLPLSISWSREGSVLMNNSQRITIYEEEVEEGGITFVQSILQICSTEANDAGVYSCIADNEAGNDTATFELTVTPSEVAAQIVLHPVNLTEIPDGDTVLLTCVAYGDLPLSISWSREGSVLMNDSQRITIYEEEVEEGGTTFIQSILQICSTEADDAGVYSCIAANEAGNDTATFELTVTPPEVAVQIVLHPVDPTDIPDGDTVLLTCVAYGDLPLSISWSKEGSVLMNDSQRITIYEDEVEEGGITFIQSILQICSTEANDAGVYSCIAANEAGNDTATFELTVTPPEVAVQIVLHPVDPTDVPDGDTVLLTCVAYGDQPLSISWSREGSVLMNDSQRITIYEEEVEEGGITFIQSILQICSTESSDAGVYSCIAANEAGNDTATFELTVTPPEVAVQIVLHPVDPTDVPDGDTVLLTCVAYGDLPLNISWSREGSVLMNDSQRITIYEAEVEEGGITFIQSILQICSTESSDAGVYSCIAANEAGNDTATFELTVTPPEVAVQIVLHPVDPTDVPDGDTVLLTCVAYGDLPLNISWSREGSVLMNDSQRITIYEAEVEEGGITFIQSILQICSTEANDAGVYSCIAANEAGNDTATFELTVTPPEVAVQIVLHPVDPTDVPDGDTVLLTCVAYGDLPLNISWSREGSVLMNDSQRITIYEAEVEEGGITFIQSILQICSTEANDAGVYSCIAANEAGNDTATFELTVTPPEVAVQIVLHPVDPTDVPDGDTVLLTCVASGDQPLSISWSREGSVLMNDSQRITIYEAEVEEGGITFIQSILQICSTEANDAGVYSCIAANEAGNDTATFELTVTPPEVAVQIVLHPVDPTDVPDGDTVLLTCVASGDQPLSISWSREGSVLMNDSQRITIYEEEVTEGGITFVQSILQICSAEINDAGSYSCTADNAAGNDTASFELTISEEEFATVVIRPTDTEVVAGLTTLLTCVGYGNPPVSITWRRSSTILTNDTSPRITIYEQEIIEDGVVFVMSILQICSTEVADTGLASCTVENGVANDTAEFQFTVEAAAPQLVISPENLTEVNSGDTVFLTCVALGEPPLAFRWTRDGRDLMNDSRVFIYDEAFEEGGSTFVQSILQVCSTEESDSGVYSCVAESEQGNATATFEVDILVSPVIVIQPPPLTDVPDGNTVLLTCVAYGDLPLTTSWSREGSVLMNDSQRIIIYEEEFEEGGIVFVQSILQVCSAESDDAGVYNCTAENAVDSVTASFELTVTPSAIPPQIVIQPEPITDVVAGETVLFTCVAYGDLPLTISWSREGSVLMNDSQRVAIYEEEVEEGGITFVQSILQICSTESDDAAIYNCTAGNDVDNVTANFELTVTPLAIPLQIVIQPEPITDVVAGETVLFTCVAYGDLPLTISWSREGSVLMNDSQRVAIYEQEFEEGGIVFVQSILQICSAESDDAAIYNCTAGNDVDNVTANFELTVTPLAIPPQIVIQPEPITDVVADETVLFTCVAYGDLPLTISWSREGSVLMNDSQRVAIYEEEVEEGGITFVQSILQICSAESDDAAIYNCTAGNDVDNVTANFELTVTPLAIPPQIVIQPEPITDVVAGETVLFTCVAYGDLPLTISWSREGSVLMNDSQRVAIYEEEFEEGGIVFVQSILQICSTGTGDAGIYSCTAENEIANTTASFEMTVSIEAQLVLVPPNSEVPSGDTILLTCVASGSFPLDIFWNREDSALMNDTRVVIYQETFEESGLMFVRSILQLCSVETADGGTYSCTASNAFSNNTATFDLTVLEVAPQIVLTPPNSEVNATDTVLLTCVAYGALPLNISWSREGSVLMNDSQRITIYEEQFEENGITFTQSILQICSTQIDDSGVYSCSADNRAGNSRSTFELLVTVPARVVALPNDTEVNTDDTILLTCVGYSHPVGTIIWSRDSVDLMNGTRTIIYEEEFTENGFTFVSSTLQICNAESSDAGFYTCTVDNGITEASSNFNLTVISQAPVIVLAPNDTIVTAGFSVALTCAAYGIPVPEISWSRRDLIGVNLLEDTNTTNITSESFEEGGVTFVSSTLFLCSSEVLSTAELSCTAANNISSETEYFTVSVESAVTIVHNPEPTIGFVDQSASFTCTIMSSQSPSSFQWFRAGMIDPIAAGGRYDISFSDADSMYTSELIISDLEPADDGEYFCEVITLIHSVQFNVTTVSAPLTIYRIPVVEAISESPVLGIKGMSTTLQFSVSADALPPVTPANVEWQFNPISSPVVTLTPSSSARYSFSADMLSLTITDLVLADEGTYTLIVSTIAGSNSADIHMFVRVPARIISAPVNTQAFVGSTATFTCAAEGNPVPTFQWRYGESTLADNDKYDITATTSTLSTLTVLDISLSDDGNYTCNVANDHGNDSASANLQVLSVPVVAVVSGNPLIGAEGTPVTLQFSISGDLPPVTPTGIVWQFTPAGSSVMQTINSNTRYDFSDDMLSLTIGALTAMDEGSYTLEATTIAGSDSATIFLDVQTASVITTPPVDTQSLVGRSATFTCAAEAEPTSTFQWSFEGSDIVDNSKYDITTTSTMSTLIILNISPLDDGNYTCNASNDHGHDFASANLQVLSVPDVVPVSPSPLIGVLGRSVTLQFSISDDLPPVTLNEILWQFTSVRSSTVQNITSASNTRYDFSDNMLSLTIGALTTMDEGSYTLEASTIAGSNSATIFLVVQAVPVITTDPMDTQAVIGSTATFTCVAEGNPDPTFQWSFGESTLADDDKYDIIATTSTLSTLTVLDISLSDDGIYTCTATNVHGNDSASANLQVLSVPVVAVVSGNPLIGAEGTPVTLQFSISGDLPPVTPTGIVWQFTPAGSSVMQTINSNTRYDFSDDMLSLTIGALTAMDEGSYTLEATTIAGSDSATIFLDVQTASVITTPPVDTQSLVGRSATFTCAAEAEPTSTFQWSFEGSDIVDNSKYDITTTSTMSTLIILNISPLDDGNYTCNASNDHGHDFASANLQVLSVPDVVPVSPSPLIGVLGRSVTLQFSISDDLPPVTLNEILWQFTSVRSSTVQNITSASNTRYDFSDNMLSLTIGALTTMDEGSYTLEASTIAGSNSATIFLVVQAVPVITTDPMDTQAVIGSTATFTCVAEGNPDPTFQWSFGESTLADDDKYDIIATTSTLSTLTVLDISLSDDGIYTCTATNVHGNDSASANLQVLSVPVVAVVSGNPLIGAEGTPVTLQFSISGDLPPVTPTGIVWQFTPAGSSVMQTINSNTRYDFSDDMLSLTIGALTAMDEGSYTLEATTIAGSDSATIFLDVQTASVITTPPVDTQSLVGRSATFTCAAEAEPTSTFQWSFEGSDIVDDNKYDITTTSTMSTLIILNISPLDDGIYTCNASNDHGHDFASANLQVLSVPDVVLVSPSPLIGVLGRSVTLQFSISDDLPPVTLNEILWQFTTSLGSSPINITSASNTRYDFSDNMLSLTIGALTAMDEGSYTLEASTIAGSNSATIFLDVQAVPVITTDPMDTQAVIGSTATFTCVAEGNPDPTFQWSFGESTLADDDKYDIIATTSTLSTLTVLDISLSDDGIYTCTAANVQGNDSASASLQVLSVPVVTPPESLLLGIEGRSTTLSFSISEDRPPVTPTDIVWRFTPMIGATVELTAASDQRYRFSDDRLSLMIHPLSLTDQGTYTLVATTIAGEDAGSIVLDVQAASMITEAPLDTQAYLGETATFMCVAAAEPTPSFQWDFEGVVIMDRDKYDIDTTSTGSRLTISDVTASDDGTYNCTVENTHGRDSASANLQVLSIPVVTPLPPSPLIGIVERNITLQFSEGNDLPPVTPADITWLFTPVDGSAIPISSNPDIKYTFSSDMLSLTITALALADEGDYELVVRTIAGNASANIILDIQVPVRIVTPPVYTEVIIGRTASLSCVVVAEPAATFQWSFGGSVVAENDKYEISTTDSTMSTLTILDVSTSDDGIYSCDVANDHGTDSASGELEVLVPPTVSVSGSSILQATEGETITLSFVITRANPPVPPSDIMWEFLFISDTAETVTIDNGTRHTFSARRISLTITNLGPMDSGTYTLTAVNSAGNDTAFIQLSVSVSPAILEDGGIRNTSVLDVREEVAFVCTVDGVPLPTSVVWLKNSRLLQTEPNSRFKVTEEEVNPFRPYILSARRSTLVITDLTTSDGGTYSCSASNGIGTAVLSPAYGLTVNEPEPVNFCDSSPCQNGGTCSSLEAGFVCMCPTLLDGPTCENRVTVSDPPVIVAGPLAVFASPFVPVALPCTASGTPQPVITWYKNGVLIPREGSQTLVIQEPGPSDRGRYHCTATNSVGTASSSLIYLNVIGILQFTFSIRIDITTGLGSRADDNELEENLVELLNQLDGASLGDNATLYSVEIPEGASINPITGTVDLIITVVSDNGEDNSTVVTVDTEVLDGLSVLLENMGREQNISFTVTGVQRFDGCSVETTVILSDSSHELDLRLQWPEMPIGAVASIPCPCESFDIPRVATRICAGDFETGGEWEDPAADDCNFSDFTRRLCLVSSIVDETTNATAEIAVITNDTTAIGGLEISTLMGLLDQLEPLATRSASLSDGLFDVIDNLLKVSAENLRESQEQTNSSGRLREMLENLADNYPLPSGLQDLRPSFTIIRDTFAIMIRLVHPDTFTGDTLSIMLGDNFDSVDAFRHENLITGINEDATAYISLPSGLFEGLNLGTDEVRLVYDIYLKDTLFMRRSNYVEEQELTNEVGSIVTSGRISSGVQVSNLEEKVELSFTKNPFARSGANIQCSFWDQSLDEGYGAWSTEGCVRVRDSSARTVCQCNHLTSFTIIADPAPVNEGLGSIVGLVGGLVCIVFLLISVMEYLLISSLRSTTTGVFLINTCLAMTALYVFTIASFYTTSSDVLCAVFSSLFHWVFLVSALALTTAAVFRVWQPYTERKRWLIFILAIILNWAVPAIIAVVSVAPNYKNYTDDQFCRPSYFPYWLGLILPWAITHVIAYGLLFLAFCTSQPESKDASSNDKTTWKREQAGLLLAMVLFDIAWGFGLPALQYSETLDNSLRTAFQIIFIVSSILLGVVVFLFFGLLSREVRKKIMSVVPGRRQTFSPAAFTDQHQVTENTYAMKEVDKEPGAQGESPTSLDSMDEKPTFEFVFSNPMTEEGNQNGAEGGGGNGGGKEPEKGVELKEELTHL